MEKTRVFLGKEYWFLIMSGGNIGITSFPDTDSQIDRDNFEMGNYFHTKEEAESVVRKLCAVLNDAEVIEMPSEEDYAIWIPKDINTERPIDMAWLNGFTDCRILWKSKIVK